ncbi:DUF2306 domain-containing protein [Actinokineospora iranica]|uniref:Predicted membrane protein n=1 Tax=Actinokineospora iranica TaxID=1271860 RepID=A0A1G6S5C7_9PSEU|nr:DUF2306 domain-containing protein [Actinokineospora iranica]SDD11864.1 Predicted membrane protein [Actinokineospora iranica]
MLISPYLLLDVEGSRLDVRGGFHYGVLVAHVFTACVAAVLGPLQFIPAVTAVPVAVLSGNPITQLGLIPPAVGRLVTGWLAVRAIRGGDVEAHRSWMARNYALTFLAVTSRAIVPILLLIHLAIDPSTDRAAAVQELIPIGQTLGWMVNLVVVEVLIRRRRARALVPATAAD